jgi:hypothetical protein
MEFKNLSKVPILVYYWKGLKWTDPICVLPSMRYEYKPGIKIICKN